MNHPPNLILGLCAGYNAGAAEVFIRSFRRNVRTAVMHIFIKDVASDLMQLLQQNGVSFSDCTLPLDLAGEFGLNIYSARHFVTRHFLRRHSDYSKVLLADVRDVLFQGDPFLPAFPGEVLFAAEDKRIQDCPTNSAWVRQGYGPDVLTILRRHTVSCAGTVLGTRAGILRYLDVMCDEVQKHPRQDTDQGIHNFIAWGLSPPGMAVDLTDSIVATLDQTPAERVGFQDGCVLVDGRVPPLVHQWDRQPHIADAVVHAWRGVD